MTGDIAVRDLVVRYGQRTVIEGLSFEVPRGSVVGIIGPNGSGKTTVLRALTGAIPCRSGSVEIQGTPVRAMSERQVAQRLAVVPQAAELPAGYTVADIVAMGRIPHLGWLGSEGASDRKAIRLAMEQTDTLRLGDRAIEQLSGGERQRVLAARALAQGTGILLLDEPTSHLDLGHQVELLHLIRRLHRECALTVVAVFHDLTLAAQFCPRLLLLSDGHLLADASPADVLTPELLARAYGAGVRVSRVDSGTVTVWADLDAYEVGIS